MTLGRWKESIFLQFSGINQRASRA